MILRAAKALTRLVLNPFGLDVVRYPKRPSPPPPRPDSENFLWLSTLAIKTIVDIGAHAGEFASRIHDLLPEAAIVSFEPLPDCFAKLQARMQAVPRFRALNCALGDRNGSATFHRNEFTPSSSLLAMEDLHRTAFPYTVQVTTEDVEIRRLDSLAPSLALEDNILVKIDVQGYEAKVILGGADLIARATLIILETSFAPLYADQPLFEDIYDLLGAKGFKYRGSFSQLHSPVDGRPLQQDSMFVRDASGPGTGTP
jgi:FkbM family methyltransferase